MILSLARRRTGWGSLRRRVVVRGRLAVRVGPDESGSAFSSLAGRVRRFGFEAGAVDRLEGGAVAGLALAAASEAPDSAFDPELRRRLRERREDVEALAPSPDAAFTGAARSVAGAASSVAESAASSVDPSPAAEEGFLVPRPRPPRRRRRRFAAPVPAVDFPSSAASAESLASAEPSWGLFSPCCCRRVEVSGDRVAPVEVLDRPDPPRRRRRGRGPDGPPESVAWSAGAGPGSAFGDSAATVSSVIDVSPSPPGRDERRSRGRWRARPEGKGP